MGYDGNAGGGEWRMTSAVHYAPADVGLSIRNRQASTGQVFAPVSYLADWLRSMFESSGGTPNMRLIESCQMTGSFGLEIARHPDVSSEAPVQSSAELVSAVKAGFGLSIQETASVLRVSRPTVYAWIRGDTKVQTAHLRRLRTLAEIAGASAARGVPELHDAGRGGSLLSLLQAANLDTHEIGLRLGQAQNSGRGKSHLDKRLKALNISTSQSYDNYASIVGPAVMEED